MVDFVWLERLSFQIVFARLWVLFHWNWFYWLLFLDLTCKRGSVGQSGGLSIPRSSVRFRLKPDNSNSHESELHRPSNKGTKLLLKVIKAIIILTGISSLESLLEGLFPSNPFLFETGFQLELNRETADNPNMLTPALFSIELWWRMHH